VTACATKSGCFVVLFPDSWLSLVVARLEETIAKSPTTALPFLTKLGSQLKPLAEAELEGLKNLKEEEEGSREFFHWDTMYYQRSNTERKHQVSGEVRKLITCLDCGA